MNCPLELDPVEELAPGEPAPVGVPPPPVVPVRPPALCRHPVTVTCWTLELVCDVVEPDDPP